jgi:5S rRNA maturation endonuclease (ribonuclease M5)
MRKQANLEAILAKFERVTKSGSEYKALCPAHADKNPSLSIKEENGKIILHCFAGCSYESIMRIIGDVEVESYDYTDEKGKILYQSVRFVKPDGNKTFKQRQPVNGHWDWSTKGVRPVLYRLREVLDAERVVVVEGEKDVETVRDLGFTATTSVGGANSWRDEYADSLRGKHVIITPDNDKPGEEYLDSVAKSLIGKAASVRVARVPEKYKDISDWNPPREAYLLLVESAIEWSDKPPEKWRELFHTFEDFENAPPLSFSIEGFIQNDSINAIAGLPGHGKTLAALSICRALLLDKEKLWEFFPVVERAERILYLIPESTITPFKHRLKLFGLYDLVREERLLIRTLSKGPTPELDDKKILYAAKRSVVIVDTAIRFVGEADDNSASDMARGLSEDLMKLLRAESRFVLALFHSVKAVGAMSIMNLENMIRGSGEMGAILATAWGLKQIEARSNTIFVQNLKPRDFEPCGPFELIGRPDIDQGGDFRMLKKPEECGSLADEQPDMNVKSNNQKKESKAANMAIYRQWVEREPELSYEEIRDRFLREGIAIKLTTLRGYAAELRKKHGAK